MLDFPNAPTTNQTFTSGGNSWLFDGVKWQSNIAQYSNNVGRNLVHNPLFNVAQRGAGPWTVQGYTADRWQAAVSNDTISFLVAALGDSSRAQIGDEAAKYYLSNTFTGNAAAGSLTYVNQYIEDVRRLAGKTVTVSFWAGASVALNLGVNILQNFGTGGSPSAAAWAQATGAKVALPSGGAMARYSVSITVPSISGKTVGTNGNDCSSLSIFYSCGATSSAVAGNIGVQSGAVSLWGVQLEIGSIATPLEKPDPQQDLAKCQRFYCSIPIQNGGYTGGTGPIVIFPYGPSAQYPTTMRAAPTLTLSGQAYNNCSALNAGTLGSTSYCLGITVTNPGLFGVAGTLTASADL